VKIQGFIFNWRGYEANALALEEKSGKFIEVTVINSEEQLSRARPGWVHLDDSAYFSAQWNKAVELFDADIFFHIQADAEFDQFDALFARVKFFFENHRLGVYEPNVDFTAYQYDRSRLRSIESEVFEVPQTDCTCWFVAGEILRKLPTVDLSINRYGWGIDRAIAALCRLNERLCVRDYRFTVGHPRSRGYCSAEAQRQLLAYQQSLSPEIGKEMARL
jgi:hypothetical protein